MPREQRVPPQSVWWGGHACVNVQCRAARSAWGDIHTAGPRQHVDSLVLNVFDTAATTATKKALEETTQPCSRQQTYQQPLPLHPQGQRQQQGFFQTRGPANDALLTHSVKSWWRRGRGEGTRLDPPPLEPGHTRQLLAGALPRINNSPTRHAR